MTRLPRRLIFIFVAAVALIAAAGFGASIAWTRYTASLGPLDLAASREGSTIVVDRDGPAAQALHFARRTLAAAGDHA